MPAVNVDFAGCPEERESAIGKLEHEAYLSARPDETHRAVIVLRPIAQSIAACEGDSNPDARCEARDRSLTERRALNAQQWRCVSEDFAGANLLPPLRARWYETPYHTVSGYPAPIGTMVELPMSWHQIQRAAEHPYVARIEPPLTVEPTWGPPLAAAPPECPSPQDAPLPKLDELQSIRGRGRQPAVVDLRQDGYLPALTPCSDGGSDACNAALWERVILNTRDLTCVNRWIDQVVAEQRQVSHGSVTGSVGGPPVPPFGDPPGSVDSFALGLTWEEAVRLAEHPAVRRIWSSDSLTLESATSSCGAGPAPETECTSNREPLMGKVLSVFEDTTEPQHVRIRVRGGAVICPLSECPAGDLPCSERSETIALWEKQNLESQRCVRELIQQLGGESQPSSDWLLNLFEADLTYSQIQEVARHPHVDYISGENNKEDDGGGFF